MAEFCLLDFKLTILSLISQISGGNSYMLNLRGVVASLEFGDSFIESQTEVWDVTLTNLDLTNITNRLASLIPSSTTSLKLANTLQYEFPLTLVSAIPSLSLLYVSVFSICLEMFTHWDLLLNN